MKTEPLLGMMAALTFFAAHDALSQPAPLEISEQPTSVEANIGAKGVSFWASITGSAGTYRWQFNGRDLPGAAGNTGQGPFDIQLQVSDVQTTNAGYYQLIATNSLGSVTSRVARLTVYTNIPPAWIFIQTNADNCFSAGARALKLDSPGNAYVTGWCGDDIRTVKLDPDGRPIWEVTYPAAYALALALDTAGNAYLTGADTNCLTLKYDKDGKLLWTAHYPAGAQGQAIALDRSGNVYVAVESGIIRYDPEGNLLWAAPYPVVGTSVALALDEHDSVFVAGAGDAGEYLVVKYDSEGNQVWLARYAPEGNGTPSAIALDSLRNVVVAGNVESFDFTTNTSTTVQFDSNGKIVWAALEPSGWAGFGTALALDSAGNSYLTTGVDGLQDPGIAAWSYDSSGKLRWKTIHNHENINGDTHAVAMVVDQEGNAYVGAALDWGLLSAGMLVLKFDSHGTREWIARYGQRGGAAAIALDAARNVYVAGYYRMLALKFAPPDIPRTRLSSPALSSDGRVEIRASGEPGRFYQLESSQDLIQWNFLSEMVNPTGEFTFVDLNAETAPRRFYRTKKE